MLKLFAYIRHYIDNESVRIVAARNADEAKTVGRGDQWQPSCPETVEELKGCSCDKDKPQVIFENL